MLLIIDQWAAVKATYLQRLKEEFIVSALFINFTSQ